MNTNEKRIDQSVNIGAGVLMKNVKNYIPMFPVSTAEEMKSALVKKFSAEYDCLATRLVFQAVNEAYALVSLTQEPLLLLPVLAEEKIQSAVAWAKRQCSTPWLRPLAMA